MTPDEARSVLGLNREHDDADVEAIYRQRVGDLEKKIQRAPTPSLREKYRQNMALLSDAREALSPQGTNSGDGNYPTLQPYCEEVDESLKGSTASPPQAPPEARSDDAVTLWTVIAVILLIGGGAAFFWYTIIDQQPAISQPSLASSSTAYGASVQKAPSTSAVQSSPEEKVKQDTPPVAVVSTGSLEITSSPPGAEVWQGDDQMGSTPAMMGALQPGFVRYRVTLSGYKDATVQGNVVAGQTTTLNADLTKLGATAFVGKWNLIWNGDTRTSISSSDKMPTNKAVTTYSTYEYDISVSDSGVPQIRAIIESQTESHIGRQPTTGIEGGVARTYSNKIVPGKGEENSSGETGNGASWSNGTTSNNTVVTCDYLPESNVIRWIYSTQCTSSQLNGKEYGGGAGASLTTQYFALDPTGEKLTPISKDDLPKLRDGYFNPIDGPNPPSTSVVSGTKIESSSTMAIYATRLK